MNRISHSVYRGGVAVWSAALSVLVLIVMVATNPADLGPFLVTGWFIVLFVALAGWCSLAILHIQKLAAREGTRESKLRSSALRRGAILAAWPISLLALSSLGQLSMRDVILSAILLLLIELYLRAKL